MDLEDYKSYIGSLNHEQLIDIHRNLDKEKFPERYTVLTDALEIRNRKLQEIQNESKKEFKMTKGRKFILFFWSAVVIYALIYEEMPTKQGFVSFEEKPFIFLICLFIFVGVGAYFYTKDEDEDT